MNVQKKGKKIVISVLGTDRPGIVALVARHLFENGCNIEDVNQTRLQTELAAIFIVSIPDGLEAHGLRSLLQDALDPLGLHVLVKEMVTDERYVHNVEGEPFVVTTIGPDRLGLVAGITEVMADFGVNITNLRAVFRGGTDPARNIMIYEVDIPKDIDQERFRKALKDRAEALGIDLNLQHRKIFEEINRI
ncbi:Glycine cleavage system transcriptional antiactivator GcvR [Dissulfuribacter thermophilus]|uniref:Glycine cleavage system transcriptional antiactivator GcvR n=1 Tax=Dissulfuribacter thermophilus TaxID=1156395 RepID=A0A1B9F4D2_9BACT|nr:ACT domain-containing protein [Dissulfuribacter thermophilus]OCC14809.1 Glycine cleavage system transcriptional antiactivator GcvR [Dissulfuribacter thermophilus]